MTTTRTHDFYAGLVGELAKLPRETEWVEFKVDNSEPDEIGGYISALANTAALLDKAQAWLVWGVRDTDHAVVGTTFDPARVRRGNEELESWLLRLLSPRLEFRFIEVDVAGARVVVLEVPRAFRHPVKFSGEEYVRVGSYKKKLKDYPEKERALWRALDRERFEDGVAVEHVADDEVARLLDVPAYFELLGAPLPDGSAAMLDAPRRDQLIRPSQAGGWDITNLGAILLARDLGAFPGLARKALRVVKYRGRDRVEGEREFTDPRGYALSFEPLVDRIMTALPAREVIEGVTRRSILDFPRIAVRELVANALIHQDLLVRGAGPMVEIFDGRIELTNPGEPLVEADRFLDSPPTSRNDGLAALMRRFSLCEERGTGIDKVMDAVESNLLPPPRFDVPPGFTRVLLFGPRSLADMDSEEKLRACYLHAGRLYLHGLYLTNSTVRERFGIEERNMAVASRLIRSAREAGLIVPKDPGAAPKQMRYLPWWASSSKPAVR